MLLPSLMHIVRLLLLMRVIALLLNMKTTRNCRCKRKSSGQSWIDSGISDDPLNRFRYSRIGSRMRRVDFCPVNENVDRSSNFSLSALLATSRDFRRSLQPDRKNTISSIREDDTRQRVPAFF